MENNSQKFIVYLTINTGNKKGYVGVHGTETPNKFDGYLGNGDLIKIWDSPKDCKEQFPGALRCCQGYLKSAGGYVFKYLEN